MRSLASSFFAICTPIFADTLAPTYTHKTVILKTQPLLPRRHAVLALSLF
eukprot:SAG31_NODE_23437_length_504_cov_1.019753_1_plen_49_part_01